MENNTKSATKIRKVVGTDVSLNGLILTVALITKVFHGMELVKEEVNTCNRFVLKKVSIEELAEYRRKEVPSFVLKTEAGLFHTVIPAYNPVSSTLLGSHVCANCHRLSAASDADGGCAKVRAGSTGIENYPWIIQGYETFATSHDCFVVAKCHHWQAYPPRKKPTLEETGRARRTLIDWWYN